MWGRDERLYLDKLGLYRSRRPNAKIYHKPANEGGALAGMSGRDEGLYLGKLGLYSGNLIEVKS
jgi:hypothetical protein